MPLLEGGPWYLGALIRLKDEPSSNVIKASICIIWILEGRKKAVITYRVDKDNVVMGNKHSVMVTV